MKKFIVLALLVSISAFAKAQTTLTGSATTFGMAPVPAFASRTPSSFFVFDAIVFKTKGFSLEVAPDLGLLLKNGQVWFEDTWVQANQKLDSAGRWTASAAVNWSIIGSPQSDGSTKSVPYPTGRLRIRYVMDAKNTFNVESWYTSAVPLKDGIKGNYTSFQYTRTQQIKDFAVSGTANIFHLAYSDGTKGFSSAFNATVSHNSGIFIATQFTKDINATHVHGAHNFSIGFTKKI